MAVTIGSNISSFKALRSLDSSTRDLSSVYERLSSGQRINRASDDAAGLAVASSLNAKSRIYSQGIRNVNDGLSMLTIAEGALSSLRDIVTRVSELSEQAASGSYSPKQRVELDREADSLLKEYNRLIQSTSFNGTKILDGSQERVYLQHGIGTEQVTGIAVANEIGERAGDGTFGAEASFAAGTNPYFVRTGDLNGDGFVDLITADYGAATTSALLGNGNGTFRAKQSFNTGNGVTAVSIADTNGDGALDIISADSNSNSTSVFLGNGNGTFKARKSFSTGSSPTGVSTGDINGDGVIDIVIGEQNSHVASVFIGNGDGSFQARRSFSVGTAPMSVALGDLNGDGALDIVTADRLTATTSVLMGNGDGTFKANRSYASGSTTYSVALDDLNGDNILDIITADYGSSTASVFIGVGNGSFRARMSFVVGTNPTSVAASDANGDGILDLVTADLNGNSTSLLIGNGNGTFQAKTNLTTGTNPRSVSFADTNGDGVKDIITANGGSNGISLFLGNVDSTGRRNNLVTMVDLKTIQGARSALDWSKDQLSNIAREMGNIGAFQSRLASVSAVLDTTRVNSLAASSRITDTDVASDSASLVQLQILQRTGQAVLAQANQSPQIALMLLSAT